MVYVILAEGFEEIEAIGTVDILRRAGIDTTIVASSDSYIVKSARDVKIVADSTLQEVNRELINNGEMLVLPGGGLGVQNLSKNQAVEEIILEYAKSGKYIAAICAAPTLLGKLGVLKDKKATCYPDMKSELLCGEYSEASVVVDGNVITSRGAGTTHLFAAKLVEILRSKELGNNILKKMIY